MDRSWTPGRLAPSVVVHATAYVVSAVGPGSHPLENAFDIGNRAGIHRSTSTAARAPWFHVDGAVAHQCVAQVVHDINPC